MNTITNLTAHLLSQETSATKHGLTAVLNQIALACKILSRDINKAGLTTILGSANQTNVQGEEQQKLDALADQLFIDVLRQSPYTLAVGTEESEELLVFDDATHQENGEFIVFIDPVDGSSNIDVNVSIGTNFVIFQKNPSNPTDYLQPGNKVVAAGYVVYGASTMLVYSIGNGVDGFTLDQSLGEFILSHPQITIPNQLSYYSINESYSPQWESSFAHYIDELKKRPNAPSARYIGSLVADFHRNLLAGGIYLYPADTKKPEGKLRLMYEAIPFAYLAEQAGGYGSNGQQNILEILPTSLHQRTPLFVGNALEIQKIEKLNST